MFFFSDVVTDVVLGKTHGRCSSDSDESFNTYIVGSPADVSFTKLGRFAYTGTGDINEVESSDVSGYLPNDSGLPCGSRRSDNTYPNGYIYEYIYLPSCGISVESVGVFFSEVEINEVKTKTYLIHNSQAGN